MLGVDSRPITPESPLANSLYDATSNIDDLTIALTNFSRVPSPEPSSLLTCCCGKDDCENFRAWQARKSRLESRLILSAEVGQALLQRHEAYVRRHEDLTNYGESTTNEDVDTRVSDLLKEKNTLEKRLTQALVNNEVTEVSSKTLLQELQEARTTISRLSANHAKSVGWETRLSVATKERDDMQQERDFESQRARLAESRFAALKDKTSKLQAEVRRLQNELEEKRQHRLESSESIIQDARSSIQKLHATIGSPSTSADDTEITNVLESLVDDNEGLKQDNRELQTLLAESRDDLYALQQELEEQRAMNMNPPRSRASTPLSPHFIRHHHSGSVPSSLLKDQLSPVMRRRNSSLERRGHRTFEPLTPETVDRDLPQSPTDTESKRSFIQPHPRVVAPIPVSPFQIEFDDASSVPPSSPEKTRTHRPLYLLTRSRGVQTDAIPGLLSPSPGPTSPSPSSQSQPLNLAPSPHDARSESSSFSESTSSNVGILVERATSLLTRMTHADALTLTNRLKRQHLRGADVGHLSRSTVSNIIADVSGLRIQFRHLLEDEKLVTMCTRKDMRALIKLLKDAFVEMGGMRVTLNDVILDPSIAPKVSELALDPAKAEAEKARASAVSAVAPAGRWIAPISKLFGAPTAGRVDTSASGSAAAAALGGLVRSTSGRGSSRPPRFVPKLGPALSASATTVNVEFSGAGVGRAVTSASTQPASHLGLDSDRKVSDIPGIPSSSTSGVMGIFAGAPRSFEPDPWVVVPKGPRRVQSTLQPGGTVTPTAFLRQNSLGVATNSMSRNVDAVIDHNVRSSRVGNVLEEDEEPDDVGPLLQRTLRRRGLSDSSIHSTFMNQEESMTSDVAMPTEPQWPSRASVLQALSRRVTSFKMAASGATSESGPSSTERSHSDDKEVGGGKSGFSLIPDFSSWAAGAALDSGPGPGSLMVVGSPRDESSMLHPRRAMHRDLGSQGGSVYGRDYY